jgi:hypothetical protein
VCGDRRVGGTPRLADERVRIDVYLPAKAG